MSLSNPSIDYKGRHITAASSLWNQRQNAVKLKLRIEDLFKAVDYPGDLDIYQWVQLLCFGLEYEPDLILELGRGRGNSTCVFTEAANHLPKCKVVSVCKSGSWEQISLPRVKEVVPKNWFNPLEIINDDILTLDYEKILAGSKRILLFWDAHGFAVAECVLGAVLPLLVKRDHVVIMHDISDNRFIGEEHFDYRGDRIWRIGPAEDGARLCLWDFNSLQEQLISILDFMTRNKLSLHSADYSFHEELGQDPEKVAELEQLLGKPFFNLDGHWFWFSLNEKKGKIFFPGYKSPFEMDSSAQTISESPASEDVSIPVGIDSSGAEEFEEKEEKITRDLSYINESFAAEAYWNHRHKLAEAQKRIKKLFSAVGKENMLNPYQWTQLIAFTLEFKPDLVIEFGRRAGNSTVAFNEAVEMLQPQQSRMLSVWPTEEHKAPFKKIRRVVSKNWHGHLDLYRQEATTFPYEDYLKTARRVLVFLDEHSFDFAEWFLGRFMPLIAHLNHVVLVHDISDARYYGPEQRLYGKNGIWRSKTWTGENLILGNVASSVEIAVSLLDFTARNHITLFSGDHSLHSFFDGDFERVQEMRILLEAKFFDTQAHWRWFSLKESLEEPTFSHYEG